jgi:uncharacterized protein
MARTKELPPPPEKPVVSPPATVAGEEAFTLRGLEGEPSLEARVRAPARAERAVVLCHPHPLYGGTMHSAVTLAIAKVLVEKGGDRVATLRFNYRGVGASHGAYGKGLGETLDARAAVRDLASRVPDAKMTLCGYSFGSGVAMRTAAQEKRVERVSLVAPAVHVHDFIREAARTFAGEIAMFLGDDDQFCDVDEARALAAEIGATLRVLEGADHDFMKSRRKLAEAVLPSLAPELG